MTLKQAAAGLPFGGGKAVLAVRAVPDPESTERRELLLRHAAFVDALGGTYLTAADMNTDASDMDVMGEGTTYVLGRSPGNGGAGDPAAGTAGGGVHGIVSSAARRFGTTELAGGAVL